MSNEIIQGDTGTVISLTIRDDSKIVDLTGATVEVAIKFKATVIVKQATVTNASQGECQITLEATDIPHQGVYSFQTTVKFSDGRQFSSQIERFTVGKKMNYVPNVGGGNSDIGKSATNGNIIVNGVDIKVYDDSEVRSEINNLKSGKHTHTNLSSLERLGINANNKLTLDGIELISGDGVIGADGKSAYQIWLDQGNTGTESDFLLSLKGEKGDSGTGGGTIPSNVIYFEDWFGGESVTIDTGSTTPPVDTTAPNNVTNLTTSNVTATSLTLNWTASNSTDVSGYEIYNGSTLLGTTAGTSYSVTGLIATTTYTFTVKAKDTSNNISSGVSVNTTTTSVADTTAPNPVTNLVAGTVTSNSIPISWTLSSSSDVANYEVAYSTNGTNYTVSSVVVNASSTSYTVTGLNASTNYTIRVVAIDGSGNRSTAATVSTSTSAPADTTAPVLTITPAATFADSQTVTMSTNETADIWYTTDGSDPVSSGTRVKYSTALTLNVTTTIKGYAIDSVGNASGVQTVTYTKQTVPVADITTDGLMLWYDGRDGSGTSSSWTDRAGGSAGTLSNFKYNLSDAVAPSGWTGTGLKFHSDANTIVNTNRHISTTSYTLEMYLEFDKIPNVSNGTIMSHRSTASSDAFAIGHPSTDTSQNILFKKLKTSGSSNYNLLTSYTVGNVYHLVVVVTKVTDTSTNYKGYMNGVLVFDENDTYTSTLDQANFLTIGGSVGLAHYANITVYSTRTYTKALTIDEITKNFNYEKSIAR